MVKRICLWLAPLIILVMLLLNNCKITNVKSNNTCRNTISTYAFHWKIDSLGILGKRNEIFNELSKNCNFEGLKWKEIAPYLGKANTEGSHISCYTYTYYSKQDSTFRFPVREFIYFDVDINTGNILRFNKGYTEDVMTMPKK